MLNQPTIDAFLAAMRVAGPASISLAPAAFVSWPCLSDDSGFATGTEAEAAETQGCLASAQHVHSINSDPCQFQDFFVVADMAPPSLTSQLQAVHLEQVSQACREWEAEIEHLVLQRLSPPAGKLFLATIC